jgi:hypothetical protein
MKKIIFGLIATVFFCFNSTAQTNSKDWLTMMESYKNSVTSVLSKECPRNMNIENFRTSLILGEIKLSSKGLEEITNLTTPLINYGKEFAKKHKLELTDEASLIFYSSFSPDSPISDGNYQNQTNGSIGSVSWADVGNCAIAAIGADALFSLAFSSATSWSIAAVTTAFTSVAKRFLGPIGVAIAVVSFSLCLASAAAN